MGEAERVMLVTLVRVPLGEVLEDIVSDLVTDGERDKLGEEDGNEDAEELGRSEMETVGERVREGDFEREGEAL